METVAIVNGQINTNVDANRSLLEPLREWRGVELNLRQSVTRPVCLGVGSPFETHDQILHVL
jgi:hypothetical protein